MKVLVLALSGLPEDYILLTCGYELQGLPQVLETFIVDSNASLRSVFAKVKYSKPPDVIIDLSVDPLELNLKRSVELLNYVHTRWPDVPVKIIQVVDTNNLEFAEYADLLGEEEFEDEAVFSEASAYRWRN